MGKTLDVLGLMALCVIVGMVAVQEQVDVFTAAYLVAEAIVSALLGAVETLVAWGRIIAEEGL